MAKKKLKVETRDPRLDLVELKETDRGIEVSAIKSGRVIGCISNLESLDLFLSVLSDEAFE